MLKVLADQAVIAIQNVETKEQLVATGRIATLGDLAGPLMHRMNNNFGAIGVWAQDIIKEGDERSRCVATKIRSLVGQVLKDAKSLQSWVDEKPEPVDLYQALSKALNEVDLPANISKRINIPNDLPRVPGSARQLTDVFHNLIQNAKEAMPDGGILSVDCMSVKREEGRWAVVKVSDTGVGITEENYEKIFQPNFSTKAASRGFGLWWTRAYVQRLDGWLTVGSRIGEGSQFTVVLPVRLPEV